MNQAIKFPKFRAISLNLKKYEGIYQGHSLRFTLTKDDILLDPKEIGEVINMPAERMKEGRVVPFVQAAMKAIALILTCSLN